MFVLFSCCFASLVVLPDEAPLLDFRSPTGFLRRGDFAEDIGVKVGALARVLPRRSLAVVVGVIVVERWASSSLTPNGKRSAFLRRHPFDLGVD